jgi:hypothetical protein
MKIIMKEKAIPAELVPDVHVSGPPAFYLGQEHLKRTKELGLPSGTRAWMYQTKHYFDINGDLHEVVHVSRDCYSLLMRMVEKFPWPS